MLESAVIIGVLLIAAFIGSKNAVTAAALGTGIILPKTAGFNHNNPGNLTQLPGGQLWQGQIGTYQGAGGNIFVIFDTLANGLRALCINALNVMGRAPQSLWAFGEAWAPAANNPPANVGDYGSQLANTLGVTATDPYSPLDADSLANLCHAIIVNENTDDPTGPIDRSVAANEALSYLNLQ